MNKKQNNRILSIAVVAFFAVFLFSFSVFASDWNEPACDPAAAAGDPTACGMAAPLNTSTDEQTKAGSLTIQDDLSVANDINAANISLTGAVSASALRLY